MTKAVNKRPPQESEQKQAQFNLSDYRLPQGEVRLYLKESSPLYGREPVNTAEKAVDLVREFMRDLPSERLCVINLDTRMRAINFSVVTMGTIDACMSPMRDCFVSALLSNAKNQIWMHNHPSSDVSPSSEDLSVTKRAVEAGRLLGVDVVDHIIAAAGSGEYYSFRENMPDLFEQQPVHSVMEKLHSLEDGADSRRKGNTRKKTTSVKER